LYLIIVGFIVRDLADVVDVDVPGFLPLHDQGGADDLGASRNV
jgi:hypothetical protein